jgi:hypothetical protein
LLTWLGQHKTLCILPTLSTASAAAIEGM